MMSPGHGVLDRASAALGDLAQGGVPLGPMTTFKVGGPAALFVKIRDARDLLRTASVVHETGIDVLVVGNGSNLLVADSGFPGLVIALSARYSAVETEAPGTVRAGGAASLPVVARQASAAGMAGMEWAVGVPGSTGGSVRMNAGGHGSQIGDVLAAAGIVDLRNSGDLNLLREAVDARRGSGDRQRGRRSGGRIGVRGLRDDGDPQERGAIWSEGVAVKTPELELGYRRSKLTSHHIVLWATFALSKGNVEESEARLSEIVRWRRDNQPGGRNCGSVFTNPDGDSAGRLIESAGLKGFRVGSASVSEKHANFFQSDAGGTAADMKQLIGIVAERVKAESGVALTCEVAMVGF